MKKFVILGSAAVALLALPVLAQRHKDHRQMMVPQTRSSVEARVKEHFAMMDANQDGSVTAEETSAVREKRVAEMRSRQFDSLDANKDGSISRDEFNAPRQARGDQPGRKRMGGLGGAGRGRGGGGMITRADTNGDGKVTLAEMSARALARFDQLDTNKDGTVTPEERKAAWGARRVGRGGADSI